jgi:hypothetical protein
MSAIEVHNPAGGDLFRIADVFAKSGMFPEARDAAQCAAKLIVGQGLGLTPYDSMNGLHIIQGKAVLAANTMAAAIKRSGKYDYRAETDDEACTIAFHDLSQRDADGRPMIIGVTTFTMNDARRAGLGGQNWKKYPRAMLFARAISAGYREHCPDALGAAPVYVEAMGETEIPRIEPRGGKNARPTRVKDLVLDRAPRPAQRSKDNADEIEAMLCVRAGVDDLAELPTDKMEAAIAWLSK